MDLETDYSYSLLRTECKCQVTLSLPCNVPCSPSPRHSRFNLFSLPMSLPSQCLAGIRACQGLAPNTTTQSPRQTVRPPPSYRCGLCAGTAGSGLAGRVPSGLLTHPRFLRHKRTRASSANPNTHPSRRQVRKAAWGRPLWLTEPVAEGRSLLWPEPAARALSTDEWPGSLPSAVLPAPGPAHSVQPPLPENPRALRTRRKEDRLLTVSTTTVLSSAKLILYWKLVKWPL